MDMVSVRTPSHLLVYHNAPLQDPAYADVLAAAPITADHFSLYDEVADPDERVDLIATGAPDVVAIATALRDRLVSWRRSLVVGTHILPQDQVPPEMADQLRAHGYWDAAGTQGEGAPKPGAGSGPNGSPTPGAGESPRKPTP